MIFCFVFKVKLWLPGITCSSGNERFAHMDCLLLDPCLYIDRCKLFINFNFVINYKRSLRTLNSIATQLSLERRLGSPRNQSVYSTLLPWLQVYVPLWLISLSPIQYKWRPSSTIKKQEKEMKKDLKKQKGFTSD